MSEVLARTPLYEEHVALGGRMVPFAGYEMPVQYEGIKAEHEAVRSSAGVFDVCHMSEFRVFGFGAFDYLQALLTNDLSRIAEVGSAQYTLMCDEDGGIIDDLIVYHTGDLEYLIIANAANRETDLEWMRAHCPEGVTVSGSTEPEQRADSGIVELVDESDRTGLIAVQGPRALGVITDLAGEGFEPPRRFHIAEARLDGTPVLLAATGYTGEDGVEILCHASHAAGIWRALLSFAEVTPCGLGARDTLRLEMGYHLYGSDMDRGVDPISAGLGWVVPQKGTPFIGSEAIARIRAAGPAVRLVGIVVEDGIPRPDFPVLRDGEEVGKVASGTFSPSLGIGIATAYLPVSLAEPGTELEVVIRRKTSRARVERPPFVKSTSLS
ncbi:MAG: glycine cleavage system aminomethyltransferase GcvT [Anaerosomatales bacterium]|nr:glycine cleavage system aminomethyltransferase GcvT [Anaerosomatales bacterium]MDT8433311.1 glycine cleavage system aminomethyltransferase GcvT [Anaerosomatales bacterium]